MSLPDFLDGIETLWGPLAALGGAFGAGALASRFWRSHSGAKALEDEKSRAAQLAAERDDLLAKLRTVHDGSVQPGKLWIWPFADDNIDMLARRVSNKVLVVANLKGGVGKSTVAASLAAYFAQGLGKRTLLVDLDYQGTATALAKTQADMEDEDCRVGHILKASCIEPSLFDLPAQLGAKAPNLWLLSSNEELDEIENGLMLSATVRRADDNDVRLRLARFLRAPANQEKFEVVVIDTPPRFSAAAVNGLLAATHVLVPTKLEESSIDAVIRFCKKLRRWNQSGFPATNFLGVLPAMTVQRPNLVRNEIEALNRVDELLQPVFGMPSTAIRDAWVPNSTTIGASANEGIAYLRNATSRAIFGEVGEAIRRRMF